MPLALAQADIFTFVALLLTWIGGCNLLLALFPRGAGGASHSALPKHKSLLLALPVLSLGIAVAFKFGGHLVKLATGGIALIIGITCCFGLWILFADIIARTAVARKVRRRRLFEFLAALALSLFLFLVCLVPIIGRSVFVPLLMVIAFSRSLDAAISRITRSAETEPTKPRKSSGMAYRLIQGAISIVMLAFFLPAYQALSIVQIDSLIETNDGAHLGITVYLPRSTGPFPVLYIRTPYNRKTVRAVEFVNAGYAVVVQDARGRFGSEGSNLPFIGDPFERPNDSWETIEWLAKQSWCNGKIATLGGSASGISQLSLAASGSDGLKAQDIEAATPSLYTYGIYPGGVFRKNLAEEWLKANSFDKIALAEWRAHPDFDDYWYRFDLTDKWGAMHWPALHVGGWYDIFSQGTLDAFQQLNLRGGTGALGAQKLVMGPWSHASFRSGHTGDISFSQGSTPPDAMLSGTAFLETALNHPDKLASVPAVTYYTMGPDERGAPGNAWHTADEWPPRDSFDTPYYLHNTGALNRTRPGVEPSLAYVFDPHNPAPTVGGANLMLPSGPMDQRKLEARQDVLKFTSDPLSEMLEVTGRVSALLWISSDAPDTDIFVKLCDVYPDGRSINICEGQLRTKFRYGFLSEEMMAQGQVYPISVDLWSTSMVFNKGHRLRVLITSSNSPAFDINTNSGGPEIRSARNTLHFNPDHPSQIVLPVKPAAAH